ncbi:MAG: hypothetical protein WBB19_11435 [Desulforhopalus sp.]
MEQFLPLLGTAWEEKKRVFTAASGEDDITRTLFKWMQTTIRGSATINWGLRCQPEIIEEGINGIGRVLGRCDLIINVANAEYIYECKRLWPEGKQARFTKSARLYVTEGLFRFLHPSKKQITSESQYASWLGFAGMLGYVMNGQSLDALVSVQAAITAHAPAKKLCSPCEPACPSKNAYHFLSTHLDIMAKPVNLHHLLLAMPV